MKICFIAPANNYHTIKWCKWFLSHSYDVHVISFIKGEIEGVTVHYIDPKVNANDGDGKKLKYLLQSKKIKKCVKAIEPDIINVHYATSYGIAAALSGIKHYFLSVWGSDVYDFPRKSFLHKYLLKYSLKKARFILSTSNAMAKETSLYTKKKIYVTPFGVDMTLFNPNKKKERKDNKIRIGIVKALTPKYGIDTLIKAFAILTETNKDKSLVLEIAGKGEYENQYRELAHSLDLDDSIIWRGFISQEEAANMWANLDIAVVPSTLESESFGVSAIEAMATKTPVVISDIPGLVEVTNGGKNCIVTKRKDEQSLSKGIQYLIDHPNDANDLANKAYTYVLDNYEIDNCFLYVEKLFKELKAK